jgi:hypothetical protein
MPPILNSLKFFLIAFVSAILLTLLSSNVERTGPELVSYGNLCGPLNDRTCLEPVLNGGFPFAYVFDRPGESVERYLFLLQDEIRPLPLVLDFLVYFSLVAFALFARRRRHIKMTAKALSNTSFEPTTIDEPTTAAQLKRLGDTN